MHYVRIADTEIADRVTIHSFCFIVGARVAEGASIGPFAHLRPETDVGQGAKIGNFVELKKTTLGAGSKANHLSYLGDATIGAERERRGRDHHVQLRRREEAPNGDRGRRLHRQRLAARGAGPRRKGRLRRRPARPSPRMCRPGSLGIARGRQSNIEGWVERKKKAGFGELATRDRSPEPGTETEPMCGIIGYIGSKPVVPVLIEGLRRMEYRGYDSAGVALGEPRGHRPSSIRRQAREPRERNS